MKKNCIFLFLAILFSGQLFAQMPSTQYFNSQVPEKANKEFQFMAFFINQGVVSNFAPSSEFLRGQVVGRMFGQNTTMSSDSLTACYVEQRFLPWLIYRPNLFNGKVIMRAAFEIDWTWGDNSYGTGGNMGGAISADQVNIQTQICEVEISPWEGWTFNIGLQRLMDNPYNAFNTLFDKMQQTGYRLSYFGTEAVGITIHKTTDFGRYKGGFYKFYENDISLNDDVNYFELTGQRNITPLLNIGLSASYVRDRSEGKGGVSILGQGVNSLLNDYNGTFKFKGFNKPTADVIWTGLYFDYNSDMIAKRFSFSGFFNYNFGKAMGEDDNGLKKTADIGGFAANLKGLYRIGHTPDDFVKLDLVYASGDDNNLTDNKYSGVITGNTWGAPGAIFISAGTYLLMPHGNVVNRYTPLIADISNMGYGLSFASATVSKSFIPYKFIGKLGGAISYSNVEPIGGGKNMGTEANFALIYNLGTYLSLEWHTAYCWLGDFYDSADPSYGSAINGGTYGVRPENPWTSFLVLKWLMF